MAKPWFENLQVGDYVCDCKCRHIRIIECEAEHFPPKWVRWMLARIPDRIARPLEELAFRVELVELWDKHLVLEDGSHCSALNCCAPVNHIGKEKCTHDYSSYSVRVTQVDVSRGN